MISRDICKEQVQDMKGETPTGPGVQIHSMSHCLWAAQQTFVYQTFAFSFSCYCLPPLWYLKPLPPTFFFVLSWRWYWSWEFHSLWQVTQFSWVFLRYTFYLTSVWFSLVNLSLVNLILSPVQKNWKVRGKFLPHWHFLPL